MHHEHHQTFLPLEPNEEISLGLENNILRLCLSPTKDLSEATDGFLVRLLTGDMPNHHLY